MPMSYTSLVASKGTAGSLMNWVNYSKLDQETVLEEAQSLLYSLLRVREMKTTWVFGTTAGQSKVALPARYLDPIGEIRDVTNMRKITQLYDGNVEDRRAYDTSFSGGFDADPFTTVLNSNLVAVELAGHDLSQESIITITEADAVGGVDLNGTWPVVSITNDDHFIISLGDTVATSAATGGGLLAEYSASKLIQGYPLAWAVYDEYLQFDSAFDRPAQCKMLYYRSPEPLSATNLTNWLTRRYPNLLRAACMAASAKYMKDTEEYNKHLAELTALVGSTNVENDLHMRGSDTGTDTPTPGDYY